MNENRQTFVSTYIINGYNATQAYKTAKTVVERAVCGCSECGKERKTAERILSRLANGAS